MNMQWTHPSRSYLPHEAIDAETDSAMSFDEFVDIQDLALLDTLESDDIDTDLKLGLGVDDAYGE